MHYPAFSEELTFPHIPFIHFSFSMHFNNKLVKQLLKTVSVTTIHGGIFDICVHLLTTVTVKKINNIILRKTHVPLDMLRMNDFHMKCMHHLRSCYAQSVLTFLMWLVKTTQHFDWCWFLDNNFITNTIHTLQPATATETGILFTQLLLIILTFCLEVPNDSGMNWRYSQIDFPVFQLNINVYRSQVRFPV